MTTVVPSTPPSHTDDTAAAAGSTRRRRVVLAASGVALVAVVGGSAAWIATTKSVTVTVDGAKRTVKLHAGTVGDVLSAEGLKVGAHDVLAPTAATSVRDGSAITLRHGRPLRLVVDGVARTVWVTADDVQEALQQVGLRADGAALSASRSRTIGLSGLSLDVRLPKATTVAVDGRTVPATSTAATVGDLLAQDGISLRPTDTTDPAVTAPVTDGLTVKVTRHDTQEVEAEVSVPFATTTTQDPNALVGTTRVVTAGAPGRDHQYWSVQLTDGVETGRTLIASTRSVQPVAQQVAVGTKPKPAPAPAPAPAAAPRSTSTATSIPTGGGGGLNWAGLANCESGGNPRAVGGGGLYFGLYQFSVSTWASVGGSGNPANASPAEQTARAQALYARTGASSWPVCGRFL